MYYFVYLLLISSKEKKLGKVSESSVIFDSMGAWAKAKILQYYKANLLLLKLPSKALQGGT
jgi:hypothetical protein